MQAEEVPLEELLVDTIEVEVEVPRCIEEVVLELEVGPDTMEVEHLPHYKAEY